MARISEGIKFSGGLGGVVGSSWNGISYIRTHAAKISNPRTGPQQDHRQKIAVTMKFLKPLAQFLKIGFKNYSVKMTPFNAAMSWNYHNALQGFYPDNTVDYSKVLVTRGLIPPSLNQVAGSAGSGTIRFTWDDNSSETGASGSDKTLLAVCNPGKLQAITINELATRAQKSQVVTLPTSFPGDLVHCYIGFIKEDGTEVSNSMYAGPVIVA